MPQAAKTLPGLNAGDVEVSFEKAFGVTCGHVQGGENNNHTDCTKPGLTIRLDLPKSSGIDIQQIHATTDQGRAAASDVFDARGALPYDGAQPDSARAWLGQHLDETTSEHFGPALFAVSHSGAIYTLNVQAV